MSSALMLDAKPRTTTSKMWKRKRKHVPEVLWRLFGHQARTLAETIVSMIPSECNCRGRTKTKFLCCCLFEAVEGDRDSSAMYYLIRPDDPRDYKKLMNRCFLVVPDNAAPRPSCFPFRNRWSQHQIVKRVIETILTQQPGSLNLICNGYNQLQEVSSISALLSSSAWHLVLTRIGDDMMNYLLMQTLIFLPLQNKHLQVSGAPISDLNTFSGNTAQPNTPNHSEICTGMPMKRRRVNGAYMSVAGRDNCETSSHASLSPPLAMLTEVEFNIDEEEQSKKFNAMKLGKHIRQPSWQRHKKPKLLAHQYANNSDLTAVRSCFENLHRRCKSNISKVEENQYDSEPQLKHKIELFCQCCSVFKTSLRVPATAQINRRPMFYNSEISPNLFFKKHILNDLNPGLVGAKYLFTDIFGASDIVNRHSSLSLFHSSRTSCLNHSLLKLLKVLIYRAKCCNHLRLLDKHCQIPPCAQYTDRDAGSALELNGRETKSTADTQWALDKSYCSQNQVVSFIWAACRSIIPSELLGGPSNWRILRRNIHRFVRLTKYEKFSLKQCIQKLKASRFRFISREDFLCNVKDNMFDGGCMHVANGYEQYDEHNSCARSINQYMFERWIFWFFSHIVVPLLQTNFYITETEYGNYNLYLYRKSVWHKLSDQAIISLKKRYKILDGLSVINILSNRSFGFSKVRFCPKHNGVRAIANLKSASRRMQIYQGREKFSFTRSVNSALRDLHAVLKDFKLQNSETLGSSVFDYNDVYRKLCPFVVNLKKGLATMPDTFIVVSDVRKAFDTISHGKLLDIINEVLVKDGYTVEKSWEVTSRKTRLWVHQNFRLVDENSKAATSGSKSFVPSQSWHSVIVNNNKEQSTTVKKNKLIFVLNELVKHNVLCIGQSFFLQTVGIPQGSMVSALLCSFYYGHMEKTLVIPHLEKQRVSERGSNDITDNVKRATLSHPLLSPGHLLIRLIDDFLFISTSREEATCMFLRLHRGFMDYNCYMNVEKFGLNFNTDRMPGFVSKRLFEDDNGISFIRWSGLLINCSTLEIQADYTRYSDNHLRSTLTVSWHGRPGHQLKDKLFGYMRPKCHPLLYDSNINSPATVRLNAYQAFLLCAMKFHSYVCLLSTLHKIQPRFYMAVIWKSLRYMHKLIKSRIRAIDLSSDFHPILELNRTEVQWLGLMAYLRVLKKKQSRHKKLLHLLKRRLALYQSIGNSVDLEYAVDDSHSSSLLKIHF